MKLFHLEIFLYFTEFEKSQRKVINIKITVNYEGWRIESIFKWNCIHLSMTFCGIIDIIIYSYFATIQSLAGNIYLNLYIDIVHDTMHVQSTCLNFTFA